MPTRLQSRPRPFAAAAALRARIAPFGGTLRAQAASGAPGRRAETTTTPRAHR
jgi:hypothetical protein